MKKLLVFFAIIINANFAFGYITSDVQNGCDNPYYMLPHFEINQYNCDAGYYLPADAIACSACPSKHTCPGGTYAFNERLDQGIDNKFLPVGENGSCSNFYSYMAVRFEINQYDCAPGYYLPAGNDWVTDNDGCTICPVDSYCPGGTYTFNETVTQGITACATGLFAPAGMWESAQCGRILHVGDGFVYLRSTKKTTPSVNVDLNHDGVADYFGNMTTLDVPMSRGTQRKLKLRYDNTTYSVYDDSVDLGLYQN